jgi:hypothetical protein
MPIRLTLKLLPKNRILQLFSCYYRFFSIFEIIRKIWPQQLPELGVLGSGTGWVGCCFWLWAKAQADVIQHVSWYSLY